MFTGIVAELGTVADITAGERGVTALEVSCTRVVADARIGDSISVNGCCLTVTALLGADDGDAPTGFRTELMGETLARTALGGLRPGAVVNLEAALRAGERLGGHLVQGHVDGVAEVVAVDPHDAWRSVTFSLPAGLERYVVEKGSVAVDGASLTVAAVDEASFGVGLIPHTIEVTSLGRLQAGDVVNVEVDVVAKYVERLLRADAASPYATHRVEEP